MPRQVNAAGCSVRVSQSGVLCDVTELVSILIPAYKATGFLAETIACARAQTWKRTEIIIVDDGSPDGTYDFARGFEGPDLKVVRQDNGGAPSARNQAYSLAQGEYIQWLDADDLLHPDKIRLQMEGAESGLTSHELLTSSWGRFFQRTDRAEFAPDALWQDLAGVDWIITRFNQNAWMNPAVWLVSRKLSEAAGPWDSRLARSGDDDGEYICRVAARSDRVRFVEVARCYYRIGTVGSLNWNMETSEQALQSLALSLEITVGHLLAVENSPRTRAAAAQHLQTFVSYFYGSDEGYFLRLADVARELGHELRPPSVSWKYRPLELAVGPRSTRRVMSNWRAWKLLIRRRLDQLGSRRAFRATGEAM